MDPISSRVCHGGDLLMPAILTQWPNRCIREIETREVRPARIIAPGV
jgi:hypothetical protein